MNYCDIHGISPVSEACKNGHLSTVQLLLNKGLEVSLYTETGMSLLFIACQNEYEDSVKHLLNNNSAVNLCTEKSVLSLCSL